MAGRRPSPHRYARGAQAYPYPERSSTATFYPASSSVDPYASNYSKDKYVSPRTSGDRVSKGLTTLAAIEEYDKYGRKISTRIPAYDPRRSNPAIGGTAPRRLSLNTSRAQDRYPPDVTYAPSSGTRAPERYDRGISHQTPVSSSAALRGGHNKHSSSIDDAYRSRGVDERSRESSFDPPRRRRESFDQHEPRRDHRGYDRHAPKRLDLDERASYEYASSKDRLASAASPRRNRSDSFDTAYSERPKPLALEYPGYKPPPSASRGLDRINGVSRAESNRARSPPRPAARDRYDSGSDGEAYQVARRPRPQSDYHDRPAMLSPTRQNFDESSRQPRRSQDPDIGNRGFGLRVPSPAARETAFDRSGVIPAGTMAQRESRDEMPPPDNNYRRPAPRPRQTSPEYDRESTKPRESVPRRTRDLPGARERDPYGAREDRASQESNAADRVPASENEGRRVNRDQEQEKDQAHERPSAKTEAAIAAGGGLAALAAGQYASRRHDDSEDSDRDRKESKRQPKERLGSRREPPSFYQHENVPLPSRDKQESPTGERQPLKELENGIPAGQMPSTNTVEDDYQRRLEREYERAAQAKSGVAPSTGSKAPQEAHESDRRRERSPSADYSPPREAVRGKRSEGPRDESRDEDDSDTDAALALTPYRRPEVEDDDQILDEEYSAEPSEIPKAERRVAIVEPPKEEKKPKGILKTRSEPFPDYPEEPKEGARPHKTAKVEGAPEDATLTKVPRSVYSTEILDDYNERYTTYTNDTTGTKMICILRVVDKDTLKKYEQKSKDLREGRHKDHHRHKDRGSKDKDKDKDKDDEDDDARRHRKHRHRSSRSKREDNVGDEEDDNSDYDDDREKA